MKIVIAGGTGFLGKALQKYFLEKSNEIFILTRNPKEPKEIYWDAVNIGDWIETLERADVLINLTGKCVDCRYTEENKRAILESRVKSTEVLQKAINLCKNPPEIWLNSSSATIYVHAETQAMDEYEGIIGDDFSMNICKSWEKAFFEDTTVPIRKVALRTSIVLGNGGGAFPKMKMISKLGLGGKQGSGEHMMSWIHERDFCRAVEFIIEHNELTKKVNIATPNPLKNEDFMKSLRKSMKIPFGLNSPVFLLELASLFIRTETELVLKSRNVYPKRLLESGFQFEFPTINQAFADLN
ncbi:TIGR01777 family oxidoreductase [Emticicia sp. BO119]|uniref:TIGR01777 family oxidoreductase n=1 Tax=Emticicia sp. BO119 TaxID=2757768 RepID=UPI0015F072B4|nr:TIGR01777 family oxidoreductase [Emticicia sp. BO119]MBA4854054.1 TIGR01777 family protein [Emticicia sp. BO119]